MLAGPSTGRLFPYSDGICAQRLPKRSTPGERNEKPQARYVVLMVTDYYSAFDDAVRAALRKRGTSCLRGIRCRCAKG